MKIVACPKGGRVPEGYCRESCLNYTGVPKKEKQYHIQSSKGPVPSSAAQKCTA